MQQIPKIVRERLKAAAVSHHPDADALTAFAEKSLPELERGVVLEHLARCGECRDVVALALPEIEVEVPAVRIHRPWLTWPALRWGFVAAGTVAIAWFGTLQYQRRVQPTAMVARQQSPETALYAPNQNAAKDVPNQTTALLTTPAEKREQNPAGAPTSGATSSAPGMTTELIQPKSAAPARVMRAPLPSSQFGSSAGAGMGGAIIHGPKAQIQQWQQQNLPAVPSASTKQQMADMAANMQIPRSPKNETVQVSGAAPVTEGQSGQVQAQVAQPEPQFDQPSGRGVGKAKDPVKVETETAAPPQNTIGSAEPQELPVARNSGLSGRNFTQLIAAAPLPRWTISSSGSLQRSFDQGATWQQVDVNAAGSAGSANLTSLDVVARAASAKAQHADKKAPSAPATFVFRAVAATGSEVWAGGTNGMLYHSLDAGNHWTRVTPGTASGAMLSGDIVSLQFADVQHGRILTSTAETWITSDDGQTWQKP